MNTGLVKAFPVLLIAAGFAVTGCASSSEVDELRSDVRSLQSDVAALRQNRHNPHRIQKCCSRSAPSR